MEEDEETATEAEVDAAPEEAVAGLVVEVVEPLPPCPPPTTSSAMP